MLCCIQISIILNFSKINICLLMNILSFILSIATRRCGSTWNDALSFNAASLPSTLRRTAVRLSKKTSITYWLLFLGHPDWLWVHLCRLRKSRCFYVLLHGRIHEETTIENKTIHIIPAYHWLLN